MERYFDVEKSIALRSGGTIETVLGTVASRYMGSNPPYDYTARPYLTNGIARNKNYRYEVDFRKIYPDAPKGSYVYVLGKYRSEIDMGLRFAIIPCGPVKIWMNGEKVFNTTFESERYDNDQVTVSLPVKKGWNSIILRFTHTAVGFGAEFGTWLGKASYFFFRGLDHGYVLIEGFDYTTPFSEPVENPSPENLAPYCPPLLCWTDKQLNAGCFGRIFPEAKEGDKALAMTDVNISVPLHLTFSGCQSGNCELYNGGTLIKSFGEAGNFRFDHELEAGRNKLVVLSTCPGKAWDFSLELKMAEKQGSSSLNVPLIFQNPFFKNDSGKFQWIYAGPFSNTPGKELAGNPSKVFDRELLVGGEGEKTYWRLDLPCAWVRLYNDNPLYGHWGYPLGVTLYGLTETGRLFRSMEKKETAPPGNDKNSLGTAIGSYVQGHAAKAVRTLEYALFDKARFGGATAVHHLLSSIDSLDDCGSFASLILEVAKDRDIGDYGMVADYVGNHILNKQDRREEGCFWRREMMHHFHNGTLWADDLYMSVPFLCRYSKFKNDPAILETAAMQFEGFRKYLYMEDKKLMAHVFDFRRNKNNGIPWGRGNGWTFFSLTELLMALPEKHPKREKLIEFYRELASGYLANQDENGMWHQVLNMPSSYIETSCTAMFICGFSRGIRNGWFAGSKEDNYPYRVAAEKAWLALENYSVDQEGNIHGVCRGSEFSFNPRYYAEHLLPRLNDTHGIGIVMLAGVELLKLRDMPA